MICTTVVLRIVLAEGSHFDLDFLLFGERLDESKGPKLAVHVSFVLLPSELSISPGVVVAVEVTALSEGKPLKKAQDERPTWRMYNNVQWKKGLLLLDGKGM